MIIESDFTDRHDLVMLCKLLQTLDIIRILQFRNFRWEYTNHTVQILVFFCHPNRLFTRPDIRSDVRHRVYALCRKSSQKPLAIVIKTLIIIMCMCIKYLNHFIYPCLTIIIAFILPYTRCSCNPSRKYLCIYPPSCINSPQYSRIYLVPLLKSLCKFGKMKIRYMLRTRRSIL